MAAVAHPPNAHPSRARVPRRLVLVPTRAELEVVASGLSEFDVDVELCGFGPIAAAARTAALIGRFRPASALLVGIAGGLAEGTAVGTAIEFGAVACYGVGAGSGPAFQPAQRLGWQQWPGTAGQAPMGDALVLDPHAPPSPALESPAEGPWLVTACSAAASPAEARWREQVCPGAVAEDMEGFGVALACAMAGVPLRIVRGISNRAGDRDKSRWDIPAALAAAVSAVGQMGLPRKS
ncbi:MAG: futalosine hydrolase [Planctomycetota bacterium]|nr:MAG: futalosine hydrolase [Planctomycetota bacterium]